ncbi:DUF499 domain-containing protein [Terrabacter carboxydivorans]
MSLAKAVYQTVPVPYSRTNYYTDITQPTPLLVGFLGRVARRLGVRDVEAQALFHLDQGMGGGKSHALVGLWHMIHSPERFFESDLGKSVAQEAMAGGHALDLSDVAHAVLIGDSMSPGRTDPRFGPATDLFGRLLWLLFDGQPDRLDRWQHYVALGPNKATLQDVFAEIDRPILIIIDELMDYAMALTNQDAIGGLPGEQGFLNALADAVDDQPHVALVVVMIRSDEDEAGYHPAAEEMREYLSKRLQRNGKTVTVTDPSDFAQIIRRRLFDRAEVLEPARAVAARFTNAAEGPWADSVFNKLGAGKGIGRLADRIMETYPFHPDLFDLVSKEWSVVQAFQRVRSTVAIFARTVLHWTLEYEQGRWCPPLIGPGDIPLQTDALEELLSSGVLAGNDRAIQGYRAVANTDIIRSGGGAGTAHNLDEALRQAGVDAGQVCPAVRMAASCFAYSLVPRAQAARGATKAELLASIFVPGVEYASAEEVFNALIASPIDGGLGALEHSSPAAGRGASRYYLSIKQTLNMYHANAMTMVSSDRALERVWHRAQSLASKGMFTNLQFVDDPASAGGTSSPFVSVDGQDNRLVVVDPRRWTLLNGNDAATRRDIDEAFGVVPGLAPTYAASMVIALVNTQRRARARDRAKDLLAWEGVVDYLDPENEEYSEACSRRDEARRRLDVDIRWAYQHYAYLLRTSAGLAVQYKAVPDGKSALNGQDVWTDLVALGRAVAAGGISPDYISQLIASGTFGRDLTPKELFTLPFSNPTWPLVATIEDLRAVLFELATGPDWMLTDSDGNEVRPGSPAQIQPGSMQQLLRPRPASTGEASTEQGDDSAQADHSERSGEAADDGEHRQDGSDTEGRGQNDSSGSGGASTEVGYEVTKLRLPLTSVTDDARREAVWALLREVASVADPARRNVDLQMMGLEITVTARVGDLVSAQTKAGTIPGMVVTVDADEL